jgi:hypothetical protein
MRNDKKWVRASPLWHHKPHAQLQKVGVSKVAMASQNHMHNAEK